MALAKSADDFIEFALDTSQDEPFVVLRVNHTRGRRVLQHERPVKGRTPVDRLTEEDVLQALLEEIASVRRTLRPSLSTNDVSMPWRLSSARNPC